MKITNFLATFILLTSISLPGFSDNAEDTSVYRSQTEKQVQATIESVDLESRLVIFTNDAGEKFPLIMGINVRNLEQVEPGDQVTVTYYEAIAAELKPATFIEHKTHENVITRAELGDKPKGETLSKSTATVTIQSINTEEYSVSFVDIEGIARSVLIETDEGRDFLAKLSVGDLVEITYTEGMAVSVTAND
jgi:hypothetical protein